MSLPNTRIGADGIAARLAGKKKLWFIGIGGVHMAAMARYAARLGFAVAGSDRVANERTRQLSEVGIPVFFGHDAARIVDRDAVIYTLAISKDNPEYAAALRLGIPLFSRADFLSYLMRSYPNRIGVAGSHGKSTVTAMLAEIYLAAGRAPTVFCGAPLRYEADMLLREGGTDVIFEACEYNGSFLCFRPTLAVLLNADHDHADYYRSREEIEAAFSDYAALPGEAGTVLYNREDAASLRCIGSSLARRVSFGIGSGDFQARLQGFSYGCGRFIPVLPDQRTLGEIRLRVPGRHNVGNAMAAVAAAHLQGIPEDAIVHGLSQFRGVGRRMEYRGMLGGALLYDDYAHHPREIAATLQTAREIAGRGRLLAVFQSHTYSRTAAFFAEICAALRLADIVWIAPIYPARETDDLGMSAEALAVGVGERARACAHIGEIADAVGRAALPGDLVVVMGAGDIDRIFADFYGKHFTI